MKLGASTEHVRTERWRLPASVRGADPHHDVASSHHPPYVGHMQSIKLGYTLPDIPKCDDKSHARTTRRLVLTWRRRHRIRQATDTGSLRDVTRGRISPRRMRTVGDIRLGAAATNGGQPVALGSVAVALVT